MHQWSQMAKRRDEWGFPLKPSPEDAAMFQNQLGVHDRTLLLGATPELQHLASVVIDHNPDALAQCRGGVLADWSDLPFAAEFDAVIGDGSLNVFQGSWGLFFQQAAKALKPLGHLVLRVFISPETKEDLQQVLAERGEIGFHAFKWKVAHAVANPYVCVKDLYRIIRPVWNHPTLEVYQNSDLVYYFPKLSELPRYRQIQFGTSYELAERCPVITWQNSSSFPLRSVELLQECLEIH